MCPLVHVLNGFYPEAAVARMSLQGLETLVAALVRCTTDAAARPKWWPATILYDRSGTYLGLEDERESKLALRQLIVNCSQFFNKEGAHQEAGKWSSGWNGDGHQRKRRRPRTEKKPPVCKRLMKFAPVPFIRLERPLGSPSKEQFLRYLRLNPARDRPQARPQPPPPGPAAKLSTSVHIPFSSDVGRLMAAREQHRISDELKLRRLEKSEWYTNREAAKAASEAEYEVAEQRRVSNWHRYRMPKRQFGQKRPGVHDVEFLLKFCRPVCVKLERMDLDRVRKERRVLVVRIEKSERLCCDVKNDKVVRSSARLRNV